MAYFSGKTGRILIGGSAQAMTNWTFEVKADIHDPTNFASSGWREALGGVLQADITFEGPYQEVLNVTVGSSYALVLDVNASTGTGDTTTFAGNAVIESVGVNTAIRDHAKIRYTAKSNGAWTMPA